MLLLEWDRPLVSLVVGRDVSPPPENTLLGDTVCDLLSRVGLLTLELSAGVFVTPSVSL